jgi:hypothetical protein
VGEAGIPTAAANHTKQTKEKKKEKKRLLMLCLVLVDISIDLIKIIIASVAVLGGDIKSFIFLVFFVFDFPPPIFLN